METNRRGGFHMSDHVKGHAELGNVEEYVRSAIQGFVTDPPDTDSQWGYLKRATHLR
jgi:hypothetical protein